MSFTLIRILLHAFQCPCFGVLPYPYWTRVLPMSWWSDGNRAWFTLPQGMASAPSGWRSQQPVSSWQSCRGFFWGSLREIRGPPWAPCCIGKSTLKYWMQGFSNFLGLFRVMANLNQNHKWIDTLLTHPSMHGFLLSYQGKHKTIDPTCKGKTHWVI